MLARAERSRQASQLATRRKNLLRKELAWLRRGAPARTSKPKFRIDAATVLIEDEPPPRDRLELERFSVTRLGKDVFDLTDVTVRIPDRTLIDDLSWSIGPGDRIGLIGINGAGKTTLLRLLTGDLAPDSGRVKRGRTIDIGHLSQAMSELPAGERVLDLVSRERRVTQVASGKEVTATSLLEDFGFTGERLTTRVGDLSGGERRRLQLLRLLIGEPNVLLLDEPTNDLDIDTLTVVEDYLDSWPGTLIVVSHDRYFLERVCDVTYALLGDGSCVLLPGGVDQYLDIRHAAERAGCRVQRAPRQRVADTVSGHRRALTGRDPPGPQGPGPDREPAGQAGAPDREAARADGRDRQRLRQAGRPAAPADGDHRRAGGAGRRLAGLRRDPRLTPPHPAFCAAIHV